MRRGATRLFAVLAGVGVALVVLLGLVATSRGGKREGLPTPKQSPGPDLRGARHRAELLPFALELVKPLATPKTKPAIGDWLEAHPEDGQTVAEFEAERPAGGWHTGRVIYLVTVGDFTPAQDALVERTRALLAAWYQLEVKRLPSLPADEIVPAAARRTRDFGPQWWTEPLLDAMLMKRPDDAAGLMAITAVDLYPDPDWNFVFGQARYQARVGVMSIFRHGDLETEPTLVLRRTVATAAHELGHMMGLQHCVAFECAMNGANSQEEGDRAPLEPCPACLAKLHLRLGLDAVRRAHDVRDAFTDAGLPLGLVPAQLDVWRDAGLE